MTSSVNSSKERSVTALKYLIFTFFVLQVLFWYGVRLPVGDEKIVLWKGAKKFKPDLAVVPEVPTEALVKALSFGDYQFYFRVLGFDIQNAGDTYGRVTPLKDYDYGKLEQWWGLLDTLDSESNFIPSLASYYYSASQEPKRDVPHVVSYLEQHADRNPRTKWWWYAQAAYLAKFKMKDIERALGVAKKLAAVPRDVKMPIWARQMPAFIYEERGELEEAYRIIKGLKDSEEDLSPGEINFMNYFIKERLEAIKEFIAREEAKEKSGEQK